MKGRSLDRAAWSFGLGVLLLLISFSPAAIINQGYNGENLRAAQRLISLVAGEDAAYEMPRHGLLQLIFDLPFAAASRIIFGSAEEWADRIYALQPIIFTAGLLTLLFIWIGKITSSARWAFALALSTGFATLIWPYAYIGLETTQSFFLLLAGYLALGRRAAERSLGETLLFAFSCGVASSVKINSLLLLPAVAWLILCYAGRSWPRRAGETKPPALHLLLIIFIAGVIFTVNAYARTLSPINGGGIGGTHLLYHMVRSPITFFLHLYSFFTSPNKGLIVYAPITLLCLGSLWRASRISAPIVIFALLALFGISGGFALSHIWAEESWGPRYLHSAVAPLTLCLALTRWQRPLLWRRELPLLATTAIGLPIALLGVIFYCGLMHVALTQYGQQTLETLQTDLRWNHIRFNIQLARIWLGAEGTGRAAPVNWPPDLHWWYLPASSDGYPPRVVDLRPLSTPQSLLLQNPRRFPDPARRIIWALMLISLICGLVLMTRLGRRVRRAERELLSESDKEEMKAEAHQT